MSPGLVTVLVIVVAWLFFTIGHWRGGRDRDKDYDEARPTVYHDLQTGEWVCNIPWVDYSYFGGLVCNHEGRGKTPQKAYIRAIKGSHRYEQIPKEVLRTAKTSASTKI